MLAEVDPDVLSVCVPPAVHADVVIECIRAGDLAAVHCEKPMDLTWGGARAMAQAAWRRDVQLTFNHQRRFAKPYTKAKALLDAGRIGALQRIEIGGPDLYDYGSHLFDLCGYMTDQTPVDWVIGQVDCRDPERKYGLYQETQALAWWRYESGVDGLASTGEDGMVRCQLRLVGDDGVIEVGHEEGPPLRIRTDGSSWRQVETDRDGIWRVQPHPIDRVAEKFPVGPDRLFSDPTYVDRAIADVVDTLREGSRSRLAAENALQTTEVIFACWESARRGGRIELPLDIDDNPLEEVVEGERGEKAVYE
jgi:predicted dehydrogenase